MHKQLAQVPRGLVRHPDAGEAALFQQLQQQARIVAIRLLLARRCLADLRRIADPQLDPQFFQHLLEPLAVAAGFQAHKRGTRQAGIELPYRPRPGSVAQQLLLPPACLRVQKRNFL